MKREALGTVCGLALLFGGCPKRQTSPRIVYVPSPPPAAAPAPAQSQQTLVIEEPAPPPTPEEVAPAPEPEQAPVRRRRRTSHTGPARSSDEISPETPETPDAAPAPLPALEPRESSARENTLRQQIIAAQTDVRLRLARLNPSQLAPADRKTLDDARSFFAQSEKALQESDLRRALVLARKAALLVTALEQH
jgi:hypothetical protein